jgi:hypothetical protein
MSSKSKEYGVVILLDALGTRERIQDDVDRFLIDWDSVLKQLEVNVGILEQQLVRNGYRTGIRIKDIFDNIQIFYPTDDPHTAYIDLTGSNSLWWSIQHSAELLTNLIRYAMTRGIYFRGCISMGHIHEYRSGFFSTALIENADFAESLNMIGIVASPSAMRVLNNKSYSSSPRFYHFVKYDVSRKNPCSDLGGKLPEKLAVLNLIRKSKMYTDTDDSEVNDIVQDQIQKHQTNEKIRRKWENTRNLINCIPDISNESLFL